jgi:hypothetical protein
MRDARLEFKTRELAEVEVDIEFLGNERSPQDGGNS